MLVPAERKMQLYYDLIERVSEFKAYDTFGEEHCAGIGISPLGTIGSWLNELRGAPVVDDRLIQKICKYLNDIYESADNFDGDIQNDFQVYLFWVLDYPTIEYIKHYLDPKILEAGRNYLKGIDRENYRDF